MEKERTVATNEADAAIEAEIAHLRADEYVRLAKRYEYARTRRKQICTSSVTTRRRAVSLLPSA